MSLLDALHPTAAYSTTETATWNDNTVNFASETNLRAAAFSNVAPGLGVGAVNTGQRPTGSSTSPEVADPEHTGTADRWVSTRINQDATLFGRRQTPAGWTPHLAAVTMDRQVPRARAGFDGTEPIRGNANPVTRQLNPMPQFYDRLASWMSDGVGHAGPGLYPARLAPYAEPVYGTPQGGGGGVYTVLHGPTVGSYGLNYRDPTQAGYQ